MVAAAYLRVYLPVESSGSWSRHLVPKRHRVITVGEYGVWEESLREDAFYGEWGGTPWVCPRHPRLRMLEGLVAFRAAYPGMVGSQLAPERAVSRATAELQSLYEGSHLVRSHILTSSWHVPLRWFAAFDPAEREVLESAGGVTIRYRTAMAEARHRLDAAVETISAAGFDDAIVSQVEELIEWLDGFPEAAMVELDYGSVAGLFDRAELAFDETAAEVAASLEALAAGDLERAGEHYATAALRWAPAQSLSYAS